MLEVQAAVFPSNLEQPMRLLGRICLLPVSVDWFGSWQDGCWFGHPRCVACCCVCRHTQVLGCGCCCLARCVGSHAYKVCTGSQSCTLSRASSALEHACDDTYVLTPCQHHNSLSHNNTLAVFPASTATSSSALLLLLLLLLVLGVVLHRAAHHKLRHTLWNHRRVPSSARKSCKRRLILPP